MRILTAAQMREVDRLTAERCGISPGQLIENAGAAFVQSMAAHARGLVPQAVAVLCGKGNNGGDGFVIARMLRDAGWAARVVLFANTNAVRGEAAAHLKCWQETGGELAVVNTPEEWRVVHDAHVSRCGVLIDALLGTGTTGPVEGLFAGVVTDVNRLRERALIFSVDIPSGVPADGPIGNWPAVRAHFTTTFTAPKIGLVAEANAEFVGRLRVASIGSPAELIEGVSASQTRWSEPAEFSAFLRPREADSHKGSYGHVLLVAGSKGKAGAAALAGISALRTGAGLVTVATPENALPTVASFYPELMTEPLAETETGSVSLRALEYGRFRELCEGKSVVAMGPGLSTQPETQEFVRTVVAECTLPLLLDADALNAFAGRAEELKSRASSHVAITPHPGEMARLLGCSAADAQLRRMEIAQECAARWNVHVVLKGHRTVMASPDGALFVNSTGNPGMATGGSGDALTGVLAGLTGQHGTADWARLLAFGVYLHGTAGDRAAARHGEAALVATDIVEELGGARGDAACAK